jgi:plasmid replication initiation protein
MTRAAFAALSLDQKNSYLQDVARLLAAAHGEGEPVPLDRDALSRLRRFYMRRRSSDLGLDAIHDPGLRAALGRMSETIHHEEIRTVIRHETPTAPVTTFREPPPDDAQLMFFVPTVHDAPLKDDVNLMDIAPFSLSKTVRQGSIRYELKDAIITIEGGAECGLVTAYDYDIFIHMVSHLAMQMRDYRIAEKRGLRPSLPPHTYRPSAAQILKFCRIEQGGRQYLQLESSLDRLQATRYKITNLADNKTRRAAEAFPLIGRYRVVSRTKNGKVDNIEIEIPDWVYQGVVTPGEKPSILTLNADYFLISRPIARFIYRLARKATGTTGTADYGLDTLYDRSGSSMPFRKFRESLIEVVEAAKTDPLPDFDIEILPAKGGEKLRMTDRRKRLTLQEAA